MSPREIRAAAAWGAAFASRLATLGHGLTVSTQRPDGSWSDTRVDASEQAREYADEVARLVMFRSPDGSNS